jgi:hypothetical protein
LAGGNGTPQDAATDVETPPGTCSTCGRGH